MEEDLRLIERQRFCSCTSLLLYPLATEIPFTLAIYLIQDHFCPLLIWNNISCAIKQSSLSSLTLGCYFSPTIWYHYHQHYLRRVIDSSRHCASEAACLAYTEFSCVSQQDLLQLPFDLKRCLPQCISDLSHRKSPQELQLTAQVY